MSYTKMSPIEVIKSLNLTYGRIRRLSRIEGGSWELDLLRQRFKEEGCEMLGEIVMHEIVECDNNVLKGLTTHPKRLYDLAVEMKNSGVHIDDISYRLGMDKRNVYNMLSTKEEKYSVFY